MQGDFFFCNNNGMQLIIINNCQNIIADSEICSVASLFSLVEKYPHTMMVNVKCLFTFVISGRRTSLHWWSFGSP